MFANFIALRFARTLEPGLYTIGVKHFRPTLLAKAEQGERWITLKPNGAKDGYVHVKIKVHKDGTAHVIGGAAGKLRGLKLNKLRSPEQIKTDAKKRKEETKAAEAKKKLEQTAKDKEDTKRASEDPTFAVELAKKKQQDVEALEERTKFLAEYDKQRAGKLAEQLELARKLELPGWDDINAEALTKTEQLKADKTASAAKNLPEGTNFGEADPSVALTGGAGMVVSREKQKIVSGLKRLERNLFREMAENHSLRDQVLGTGLNVDDVLPPTVSGGMGFASAKAREAQANGVSEESIKAQRQKLVETRLDELAELDPDKAKLSRQASATMRSMHDVAGILKESGEGSGPRLETDLDPSHIKDRADTIKAFLAKSQELRALDQKARQYAPDTESVADVIQNRDPSSFVVDIDENDKEFLDSIKQSVQDLEKEDLTRSFFEKLNMDDTGLSADKQQRALIGKVSHGAYSSLNAALLTATGHSGMDRQVLDTLGLEAAAKITAWRLQNSLDPSELQSVKEGLASYHDETSLETMQRASENAERAKSLAMEINLPDVSDSSSLVVAKELNKERTYYLEEAIHELGTALGQVEAGAALNLAMSSPIGQVGVAFHPEANEESVLTGLAALGLKEGNHYTAQKDISNGALGITLHPEGLEQLSPKGDAKELALRAKLEAIRKGEMDESDWLPAGFVSYPKNIHNDPEKPEPFASQPDFSSGAEEGLKDFVGSRLADGWQASDILRDAGSIDFVLQHVPEAQREDYANALNSMFPLQDAEGKLRNVDTDEELKGRFQGLAKDYVAKAHPNDTDFHSQGIGNDKNTHRAAYLATVEDPRTQVAYKGLEDLGLKDQHALRSYFLTEVAKVDESGRDTKAYKEELGKLGKEPEKFGEDMFGSQSVTPEWSEYNAKKQGLTEKFAGPTAWAEFVEGMRGLPKAYEAVQEHMQGRVAERFAKYHGNLNNSASLRVGKAALKHGERFKAASSPEARAELLAQEQGRMAGLRERVGGQFAAEGKGSVVEKLREQLKQKEAFEQSNVSLFDMGGSEPQKANMKAPELKDEFKERFSLGSRAEAELASILPYAAGGLGATSKGVRITPGITMGEGKYVQQQRAIKFAKTAKKTVMALGMGCVHGDTVLEDAVTGEKHSFEKWLELGVQPNVWALNETTKILEVTKASKPYIKDYDEMYRVRTKGGKEITVTNQHRFLTPEGWMTLEQLSVNSELLCAQPSLRGTRDFSTTQHFVPAFAQPQLHEPHQSPNMLSGERGIFAWPPHSFFSPCSFYRFALIVPYLAQRPHNDLNLLEYAQALRVSNLDVSLSKFFSNVRNFFGIGAGSRDDYHYDCRSRDGQLREARDTDPKPAPSLGGVRARSHPSSLEGGQDETRGYSQSCQQFFPRAKNGFYRLLNFLFLVQPSSPSFFVAPLPNSSKHQAPYQFRYRYSLANEVLQVANHLFFALCSWFPIRKPYAHLKLLLETFRLFSQSENRLNQVREGVANRSTEVVSKSSPLVWDTIKSIIPIGKSYVYDITVPGHENYLAHGFINHNSGKSALQIGTFTDLHSEGKARKALMVVPSVVRNQFGEQMAQFTEPGKYKWHTGEGSYEDRLKAYQDKGTHMNVVTHQTFRDDVAKMLTQHQGYENQEGMQAAFEKATPSERRQRLRAALEANGVDHLLDYVTFDEAHALLNRDGKPDSFLAQIGDAAIQEAKYGMLASGTPTKNDASETHSLLEKVDPERWEGKGAEFKRRFGVDLPTSQEAFKREMGRYVYASKVPSGVTRKEVYGREVDGKQEPLELHPEQQKNLDAMYQAYEKARQARRMGSVDKDALKVLSPRSFEGLSDEEAATKAQSLNSSLGTLKFAAQARILEGAPAEGNVKIQHLRDLAKQKKAEGKPGVVFAHSLQAVEEIKKALEADGHRVDTVTGADSSEKKAEKRNKFHPAQGEPETDILVMSDAGAVGMNLQRGQWLVNHDLPMTDAIFKQRGARVDRIGQTQNVEIHNLVTNTQYEKEALQRLKRKGMLQDIFESEWEGMDDAGLAKHISLARSARTKAA